MTTSLTQNTLTVYPDHFHTITGSRRSVLSHFKEWGVALWLRANGSATLFYKDNRGIRSQKTWSKVTIGR